MRKLSFRLIYPLVITCLLCLLFFLPMLIQGKVPIPADDLLGLYHPWRDISAANYNPGKFPAKNPLITDPILQTYPWRLAVINNFKVGSWPLWNPYNFSGQPLLGNYQSSPFNILNILFFMFPFNLAWSIQIILSAILTTVFMYLFLRNLNLSKVASIFGGFILPFSGFFVSWLTWGTVVTTAMWLPLILLLIEKVFSKKTPLYFLILILAASFMLFAGHLQTAIYILFASAIYTIFQFLKHKNSRALAFVIFAFIISFFIASPQILPSLEFTNLSNRSFDQSYFQGRNDWFIPLQHLAQLIAPDFFGNPTTNNYWGVWNYGEYISFVGLIPLSLAFFAVFKKKSEDKFPLFIVIFSLILALKNPLSLLPYNFKLPAISSMQPSRIIFLLVFALCTLSAIGFDLYLAEKSKKRLFAPLLVLALFLSILFLSTLFMKNLFPQVAGLDPIAIAQRNLIFPLLTFVFLLILTFIKLINFNNKLIILAIFLVSTFELFRFAYKFTPFVKLDLIYPQTKTTQFLESQNKPYRLISLDRRVFNAASPSVYKIEVVHGYDPLFLRDYGILVSSWQAEKVTESGSFNRILTPEKFNLPLINLLNIKYLATLNDINDPKFIKVFQEGETRVYENKNVLPRAFLAQKVVKLNDNEKVLEKIINPSFNPIMESFSTDFEFPIQENQATVTFQNYSDQAFSLRVETNKVAPLIVSNIFYPGWKAYIDKKQVVIQKINYIFQSIIIPSGTHQVDFKYEPQSFYNGLALALIGLVLTVISFFVWRKKFQ